MATNVTKKRTRQIILPHGMRKEIAEVFGVTPATVWYAINYKSNSKKAQAIRALAEKKLAEINNQ